MKLGFLIGGAFGNGSIMFAILGNQLVREMIFFFHRFWKENEKKRSMLRMLLNDQDLA